MPCDILDVSRLEELFGAWPIFCGEDPEQFEKILGAFANCLRPEDAIVGAIVVRLTVATWHMKRLPFAIARTIEGRCRQLVDAEAQLILTRNSGKDEAARKKAAEKVEEMMSREPSVFQINRSLVGTLDQHGQLQKLLAAKRKEFDTALATLERHRKALGKTLRSVANGMIDAQPAPSIVPANVGSEG